MGCLFHYWSSTLVNVPPVMTHVSAVRVIISRFKWHYFAATTLDKVFHFSECSVVSIIRKKTLKGKTLLIQHKWKATWQHYRSETGNPKTRIVLSFIWEQDFPHWQNTCLIWIQLIQRNTYFKAFWDVLIQNISNSKPLCEEYWYSNTKLKTHAIQ